MSFGAATNANVAAPNSCDETGRCQIQQWVRSYIMFLLWFLLVLVLVASQNMKLAHQPKSQDCPKIMLRASIASSNLGMMRY